MGLKLKTTGSLQNQTQNNLSITEAIDKFTSERSAASIEDLLRFATEHNCSDLYVTEFEEPFVSCYGKIYKISINPLDSNDFNEFCTEHITHANMNTYVVDRLLDTSVQVMILEDSKFYNKYPGNQFNYRVSFGWTRNRQTATFRMIKPEMITFDNINYNAQCIEALKIAYSKKTGIAFTTGPTGSGKSTTMAACINTFTRPGGLLDNKVIITLEDPIENTFYNTPSVKIMQKELDKDFLSFGLGIKAALREHPNMIIVGECRDKEVICAAIEAARTGHVVSTTFHSSDVSTTVSRLLYHLDNDPNLALDLISQLNIILSQRMLKKDDKYEIDTQYLLFDDYVTKRLIDLSQTKDINMAVEVDKLMRDSKVLNAGISKLWDYDE